MRNLMIIGIVVACAESAWSLSYMGPPTSQVMPHHYKLGVDFSTGKMNADLPDNATGLKIKDLDTDLYLARLDYGIYEKVDVYARLGLGEIEDLGNELAWGIGMKSTLSESGDLTWGGLVQMTSISGSKSTTKLDIWEMQLAAGPVWKMNEAVGFYGGPFLHWISGDMKRQWPGQTFSSDIEQESLFGIYAGIACWVTNQGELNVEYQITPDADALGVSLVWRF